MLPDTYVCDFRRANKLLMMTCKLLPASKEQDVPDTDLNSGRTIRSSTVSWPFVNLNNECPRLSAQRHEVLPYRALLQSNQCLTHVWYASSPPSFAFAGFAELSVNVNAPPLGGHVEASPRAGTAAVDSFLLQSLDWTDDDLPLLYSFSYTKVSTAV